MSFESRKPTRVSLLPRSDRALITDVSASNDLLMKLLSLRSSLLECSTFRMPSDPARSTRLSCEQRTPSSPWMRTSALSHTAVRKHSIRETESIQSQKQSRHSKTNKRHATSSSFSCDIFPFIVHLFPYLPFSLAFYLLPSAVDHLPCTCDWFFHRRLPLPHLSLSLALPLFPHLHP